MDASCRDYWGCISPLSAPMFCSKRRWRFTSQVLRAIVNLMRNEYFDTNWAEIKGLSKSVILTAAWQGVLSWIFEGLQLAVLNSCLTFSSQLACTHDDHWNCADWIHYTWVSRADHLILLLHSHVDRRISLYVNFPGVVVAVKTRVNDECAPSILLIRALRNSLS